MHGFAFIMFVQICNLIWRNVTVYLDLITNSSYLLCIHLNHQHTEVSLNWIALCNHFKARDTYIPRSEDCGNRHSCPVSCHVPAEQGLAAIQKRNPETESEFHHQSVQQWQKGPFQPLRNPVKDNLLPYITADFSQYANTNILLHTRKVLLMHISWFSPFTILWCFTDLSWRTLNSACMKLTQKAPYKYRWIIRPKDQTRNSPKQNPLY